VPFREAVNPTDFLLLGAEKRQKEGEEDYGRMNTHSFFASHLPHAGDGPSQDEMMKAHHTHSKQIDFTSEMIK
jgi:hypothetical protein